MEWRLFRALDDEWRALTRTQASAAAAGRWSDVDRDPDHASGVAAREERAEHEDVQADGQLDDREDDDEPEAPPRAFAGPWCVPGRVTTTGGGVTRGGDPGAG